MGQGNVHEVLGLVDLAPVEIVPGPFLGRLGPGDDGQIQQAPGHGDIPEGHQGRVGAGGPQEGVGRPAGRHFGRRFPKPLHHPRQGPHPVAELLVETVALAEGFDFPAIGFKAGPLPDGHLAAHQVHGLDAVGALVEGHDLGVAQVLLDGVVLAVAVSAQTLHGRLADPEAHVRTVGLDNGGHEVHQVRVVGPLVAVRQFARQIGPESAAVDHRTHAVHHGLHPQQHAAHVRVVDDGHLALPAAAQISPLPALLGVGQGIEVGRAGHGHAADAGVDAGRVHHLEHVGQPHVFLAAEIADAVVLAAEGQGGRGGRMQPQLFFDAGADHVVGLTQRAVRVDTDFGHDEKGYAPDALRRPVDACQNQMDDVLGNVVVAPGDEYLVALDPEGLPFAEGRGLERGQVGAGVGLRQAHGAGPGPIVHFGHETGLEIFGGKTFDQVRRPVGQTRRHVEGLAGPVHQIVDNDPHHVGESLAAVSGVTDGSRPPVLAALAESLPKAGGARYLAVGKADRLFLTDRIERVHHPFGEVDGFGNQKIQGFLVEVPVARQLAKGAVVELVFENEEKILLVDFEAAHARLSCGRQLSMRFPLSS